MYLDISPAGYWTLEYLLCKVSFLDPKSFFWAANIVVLQLATAAKMVSFVPDQSLL